VLAGLLARGAAAAAAGGAAATAARAVGVGLGVGGALLLAELGTPVLKPHLSNKHKD